MGPTILDVGLRPERQFSEDDDEECLNWGETITEIDVDLAAGEESPDTIKPRHQSFGLDELRNVERHIDLDLLPQDVLSEIADEGPAYARTGAAKSPIFTAAAASALIHMCLFLLFAFVPETRVAGAAGHAGNVISVRIIASEDLVPQDESPASVDSAASMPSTAGKIKKPKKLPPARTAEPPPEMREVGHRPEKIVLHEKQTFEDKKDEQTEERKEKTRKIEDRELGDGPQNSMASMPSVASAERQFIPAAGRDGEAFQSRVLSAIREAIFFPKQAVKERHHGEVVVAFAITKDGSISSLHVAKPSGSPILDEAAIKIIQKAAAKFPAIPDTMNKQSMDYVVPILFKEKRG